MRRTLLGGIAVGLVAPLTYLPLVLTQSVTYRSDSKIGNSGLMVPGLGDLLNASTPSFAAWVDAFEKPVPDRSGDLPRLVRPPAAALAATGRSSTHS